MSESTATATLRRHLRALGAHVQAIQDGCTPGIPDTNLCHAGREIWLEGKFVRQLPTRDRTLVRFGRPTDPRLIHQRHWLDDRRAAGGYALWWVRVRDGGWYLLDGHTHWLTDGVPKQTLLAQENLRSAKAMAARLLHGASPR